MRDKQLIALDQLLTPSNKWLICIMDLCSILAINSNQQQLK